MHYINTDGTIPCGGEGEGSMMSLDVSCEDCLAALETAPRLVSGAAIHAVESHPKAFSEELQARVREATGNAERALQEQRDAEAQEDLLPFELAAALGNFDRKLEVIREGQKDIRQRLEQVATTPAPLALRQRIAARVAWLAHVVGGGST